ncbi:MAG: PAS domain S-box protein [Deltaproteobacteria bacterium]|nr:PAS domain S-box protein [Deltaproteobacteria bacterium]MBW2016872.1 PAS domain S-box protein [Deltaproteobacteria bacterium]
MGDTAPNTTRLEIARRLQKLMFLRVLFVTLLLGASIFLQIRQTQTYFGPIQASHYFLIVVIYFLTFWYILFLKRLRSLVRLAYVQLLVDTGLVTAIIYTTGGMDSIFSFLYILTIINACMLLYRRGGLIIATASSLLYGLLLALHYYEIIHPFGSRMVSPPAYLEGEIFYSILVNSAAFYLVAFLASFLSEQVRKGSVELKARQNDILKLEALNERIIRSITSGLITLNHRGRVILFNPAAEAIFGISARESIGRPVRDVLPVLGDLLNEETRRSDSEASFTPGFIDFPFKRRDGEERFLRLSVSTFHLSEAGEVGRILVIQDMTEIRKIEDEMKRVEGLAMVGELAAGIAHEIRNPMASISGSVQMLKEEMGRDSIHQRLMDIVLREINRLNSLVSDFLLFARPRPANFRRLDLNQLILESLELFRNTERWQDHVQVKTELTEPLSIESDPEQIKQVLWNLYLNAVEAMPKGGTILVRTGKTVTENPSSGHREMAEIVIRDTGEGFREEALENLFTPFYTTKAKGSGLGLAIVKRIVEGLKGEVHGKNHPGGGAEVIIRLPFTVSKLF